eukprot:GEMP01027131.1.p1 GENE.GEMP01027131.1~~GEMP01027131.1.p1  ORF type:complete len:204 (+),score=33.84 GEMP01027131.1:38-649(+)
MAQGAQPVLIYYHIPADHDDPANPNAFPVALAPGTKDLKLKELRKRFPLPGIYHFRFRMRWEGDKTIWMDVTNDESPVPRFEDKIIAKVLRLSWHEAHAGATSATGSVGSQPSPVPKSAPKAPSPTPSNNTPLFDLGSPTTVTVAAPTAQQAQASSRTPSPCPTPNSTININDPLGGLFDAPSSSPPQPPPASGGDDFANLFG